MKRTSTLILAALLAGMATTAAAAPPALYIQGGLGYQIGMREHWTYQSEHYHGTHTMDLPPVVGSVEAGVTWRGWFLQGQHVSSIQTNKDCGFNVITAGYRLKWEF